MDDKLSATTSFLLLEICLCRDGSCEADSQEVHWGREGSSQEEGDLVSSTLERLFRITMILGVFRGPSKSHCKCSSTDGAPKGEAEEEEVQGGNCGPEGDQALPEIYRAADQEAAFPAACQEHSSGVCSQLSYSDWRPCRASIGRRELYCAAV